MFFTLTIMGQSYGCRPISLPGGRATVELQHLGNNHIGGSWLLEHGGSQTPPPTLRVRLNVEDLRRLQDIIHALLIQRSRLRRVPLSITPTHDITSNPTGH
ncbi:hypothetical protein C8F04DRAFT_1266385 [Mycena alexandri]|uniref:Uncharacterized protein n=1 Tax=Mycena alexandri TaxID=1745969 RepID=A0AAD6SIV6_9AGAR|nr:hypothetical protein C8F04DRAFT_1266385 [Mycena alexandri]